MASEGLTAMMMQRKHNYYHVVENEIAMEFFEHTDA